jgi:hypothetical protein
MKQITLRTKITLTILGLLALTGMFYAANPTLFTSGVSFPTAVAGGPGDLFVTPLCSDEVDSVDGLGNVTLFATLPGFGSCREKYLAIAPSQSVAAGFTPRDVFVTQSADDGPSVYQIHDGTVSLFATPGCLSEDQNGITFDHVGTFGFNMIVTCNDGGVFMIDGSGTVTSVANTGTGLEGPAVVPVGFGPHGGEIWAADEENNAIHAVKNNDPTGGNCCGYTVTLNILSHVSAEGVFVIPSPPSSFFLAEQQDTQKVYEYPPSNFIGLGGNVLITSEEGIQGADTSLVTTDGISYFQSSFGPRGGGLNGDA